MSGTAFTKTIVLNSLLLNAAFPSISNLTIGLFVSGVEVSATEYQRASITFDSGYANTNRVAFPMAESSWGSPNTAVLMSDNNQIASGTITPGTITAGYRVVAEIGNIVVNLT